MFVLNSDAKIFDRSHRNVNAAAAQANYPIQVGDVNGRCFDGWWHIVKAIH